MEQEVKKINLSILGFSILIGTIIVSIILLYNKKLRLEHKKELLTTEQTKTISLINNIIVFLLALLFLYIAYLDYLKSKESNKKGVSSILLLLFNFLPVLQAIYLVFLGQQDTDLDSIVI